jgi:hypothetical protein
MYTPIHIDNNNITINERRETSQFSNHSFVMMDSKLNAIQIKRGDKVSPYNSKHNTSRRPFYNEEDKRKRSSKNQDLEQILVIKDQQNITPTINITPTNNNTTERVQATLRKSTNNSGTLTPSKFVQSRSDHVDLKSRETHSRKRTEKSYPVQSVRISNRKQMETIEINDTNVNEQLSQHHDEIESDKDETAVINQKVSLEPILESHSSLPTIEEALVGDRLPYFLADNHQSVKTSLSNLNVVVKNT